VRIKWPNDVFVDGKKCAGVLVETRSVGAQPTAVIVGVGVNVNRQAFDPALAAESTSLALVSGASVDRELLLATLLGALERQVARFLDAGPGALARDVEARLLYRGQRVLVDEQAGLLAGVDPDGALRICDDEGVTRRVVSGRLRPA
jgi:BirA family biotin operon repressor/biotin-[acetyl-CoA-carboxylase] ligase